MVLKLLAHQAVADSSCRLKEGLFLWQNTYIRLWF